jgi:inositol 2-dehydrogenase
MTVRVGVIGVGMIGQDHIRRLTKVLSGSEVVAVTDVDLGRARDVAEGLPGGRVHDTGQDVIDDDGVDAVLVASWGPTHEEFVLASIEAGKPVFCEKPLALTLDECKRMQEAVARRKTFFQMGFMRRFDPGYAAARQHVAEGRIGTPVVFKSTSRDPYRPSLEYANPASSGGILVDMGIHDFDLARWFMGDVATVSAIGGTLAYPELASVGDLDNAIATMTFATGCLGVVDLTRNGFYGYDISTELLGTQGTIRIGYLRETPIVIMTKNSVAHDTVPYFMERFERAYTLQLQNFAQNVLETRDPPVTIHDGIEALRVARAATDACRSGHSVSVASVTA